MRRARVLVVDDRAFQARMLAALLFPGVECAHAPNLRAAREAIACAAFDLYVLDLDLGDGSSGLDLLPEIRARDSGAPAVVYTADTRARARVEALGCRFFVKGEERAAREIRALALGRAAGSKV